MLSPSELGLEGNFRDYSYLTFKSQTTEDIKTDYHLDRIKQSHVTKDAKRTIVRCETPDGHPLDIEWYVSNNDVAFRYNIIKDSETGSIRIMQEQTSFNFPEGTTTYLCPQSDAMVGWKRTKPSYEEYYKPGALLSVPNSVTATRSRAFSKSPGRDGFSSAKPELTASIADQDWETTAKMPDTASNSRCRKKTTETVHQSLRSPFREAPHGGPSR